MNDAMLIANINASWVKYGVSKLCYKISLILSKKKWMVFKEIAVFCELTKRGSYKNWA